MTDARNLKDIGMAIAIVCVSINVQCGSIAWHTLLGDCDG